MTIANRLSILALAFAIALVSPSRMVRADEPNGQRETKSWDGVWLFESAKRGKMNDVSFVWHSQVTITKMSFSLSKFLDCTKDVKGTFAIESANIDLNLEEFDLAETGAPMKIPAGKLLGIWKHDADRLTICLNIDEDGKRPTEFVAKTEKTILFSLRKAPADFKEFPKEITVKVAERDGTPASGVTLASFMSRNEDPSKKDKKLDWDFGKPVKTDANGKAKLSYEEIRNGKLIARDLDKKQIAFQAISPYQLVAGEPTIVLQPEHKIVGTIECDELKKLGRKMEWTNVYLQVGDERVAQCSSFQGQYEFVVPAGQYKLHAYGNDIKPRDVVVDVPEDRSELQVDPIQLNVSKLVLLQGTLAPEFEGVVGWSGKPVKLADLRGKIVLVDFWGYWCGPCVRAMPVLIELHEKFAEKGLAIVGVHLDGDGEIDTANKLTEKIAGFKKELWNGKDLPFSSALTSGKRIGVGDDTQRGGTANQYGILSYPTTVMIGRDGKIVGEFHARDIKSAVAQMEKLLQEK